MDTSVDESPQTRTAIEAVVFDYGNVLSLPQRSSDVQRMADACAMSLVRFHDRYWKFRDAYDRAELNGAGYWASVVQEDGRTLTADQTSQLISLDIHSWLRINEATMKWVEHLHGLGVPLALLSNMPPEIARHIENNCAWASFFDPLIFSCDLGVMKPDKAIYAKCLASLKFPAEKVLFLDDRAENVIGAAQLGIHSAVFDSMEKASEEVGRLFDIRVPAGSDGGTRTSK